MTTTAWVVTAEGARGDRCARRYEEAEARDQRSVRARTVDQLRTA